MMRFEIITRLNLLGRKRWYVRLVAENGETLCISEALNSRQSAMTNINATRRCCQPGVKIIER